jgi:hypothetical protein
LAPALLALVPFHNYNAAATGIISAKLVTSGFHLLNNFSIRNNRS